MRIPTEEEMQELKQSKNIQFERLVDNYSKVYYEYYTTGSRDSAFIKDLLLVFEGISAVLEVYTRDKQIDSGYAIEKLKIPLGILDYDIKYFESKEKADESNL